MCVWVCHVCGQERGWDEWVQFGGGWIMGRELVVVRWFNLY